MASRAHRGDGRATHLGRVGWPWAGGVLVGTGLLGAVATMRPGTVAAVVGLSLCFAVGACWTWPGGTRAWRHDRAAWWGTVAGVTGVLVAATGVLAAAGLGVLMLWGLALAVSRHLGRRPPPVRTASKVDQWDVDVADHPQHRADDVEEARDLSQVSDEELCRWWRASYAQVQRATDARSLDLAARARQQYLDELCRRHPREVAAWLGSGARAAGDPARYLGARRPDRGARSARHEPTSD